MIIGPKYKIARRLGVAVFEKTQTQKYAMRAARKDKTSPIMRSKSEYGQGLFGKAEGPHELWRHFYPIHKICQERSGEERRLCRPPRQLSRITSRQCGSPWRIGPDTPRRPANGLARTYKCQRFAREHSFIFRSSRRQDRHTRSIGRKASLCAAATRDGRQSNCRHGSSSTLKNESLQWKGCRQPTGASSCSMSEQSWNFTAVNFR